MRKLVLTAAALVGVAAVATPAMAQDADDHARGRFHVEAIAGYDTTKIDNDTSGAVYGIGAGYDFHLGRTFTIGADAEVSGSTADECTSGLARAGDLSCISTGRDFYVGGRIGARFGRDGRHMAYVGGGYTNARYSTTYDDNLPNTPIDNFHFTLDGFRLKGGVEIGIGRRFFARAEYRYSEYDNADVEARHQVVGAIGLRF